MTENRYKKTAYYLLWIAVALIGIGFISPYENPVFAGNADPSSRETIRSGAEIDYPPSVLLMNTARQTASPSN